MALNDYISKGEFDRRVKLIEEKLKLIKDDGLQQKLEEQTKEFVDRINNITSYNADFNEYSSIVDRINSCFDANGEFDGSHIKPLTIETAALSVGQRSQALNLKNVKFSVNDYTSGYGVLSVVDENNGTSGNGLLTHYTLFNNSQGESIGDAKFNISYSNINLSQSDDLQYIYAKLPCTKASDGTYIYSNNNGNPTAIIEPDTRQRNIEGKTSGGSETFNNCLWVLLGTVSKKFTRTASDGTTYYYRIVDLNYGLTTINGRLITTGRIAGTNSDSAYFDLDKGEIGGKIIFKGGDNTYTDLNAYLNDKYGEITSYVNNNLLSDDISLVNALGNLQDQIDGVVDSYFLYGIPTMITTREPISTWDNTDPTTKYGEHIGDTYTDILPSSVNLGELKNQLPLWIEQGKLSVGSSNYNKNYEQQIEAHNDDANYCRTKGIFKIKENITIGATSSLNVDMLICYYDENELYIGDLDWSSSSFTFDSTWINSHSSAKYFSILYANSTNRGTSSLSPSSLTSLTSSGDIEYPYSGGCWRFVKENSVYSWFRISDSLVVEALQKAAQAQSAADGKRRVFVTTPTPPYDSGDLWANATYPSNGSTYRNVLLRCDTPKTSSQLFDITDWTPADRAIETADLTAEQLEAAKGELSAIKDGTTTIAGGMITNNLLELKNIVGATQRITDYVSTNTYYKRESNSGGYAVLNVYNTGGSDVYPSFKLWERTTEVTDVQDSSGYYYKEVAKYFGGGTSGEVTAGLSGISNFPCYWSGGTEVQAANYVVFKNKYHDYDDSSSYPSGLNTKIGWYNELIDFIFNYSWYDQYNRVPKFDGTRRTFPDAIKKYDTLIRYTPEGAAIDSDVPRLPVVIIDFDGFCKFGDFYIYDNQAYYDNQSGFGHYKINLNGSDITPQGTLLGSFYAPTDYGTSGYVLKSNGINTAPSWIQTLPVANGGTNATTAANARANLGTWSLVSDSYNTLMPANGTSNGWVKIGTANSDYGIIPSQSGGAGSGHNYLGTSTWYWKYAYIDQIYGYLNGNISGSSTSCSGNAATATTATFLWSSSRNPTYGVNRLEYFNNSGTYGNVSANSICYPTSDWYHFLRMNHGNNNGYYNEIASSFHDDNLYWRRTSNGTAYDWKRICMTDKTIIPYPNGGTYRTSTSSVTGALKIRLPKKYTSMMLSFWVDIYNYSDNQSVSYYIGGYNYSVDSNWYNCFSRCIGGNSPYANLKVRFGDDGTYCCILIGETSTTWAYPQVFIRDVQLGYSTPDFTYNSIYWNISFVTTLPTVNKTIDTYNLKANNYTGNVNGYTISSTVNAGTANYLAYYNTANEISGASANKNYYVGGPFHLMSDQYNGLSSYGLNCHNSDIVGVNSILTQDTAENFGEGICFYRSSSTWDCLSANDGTFYFGSNKAYGAAFAGDATIKCGDVVVNTGSTTSGLYKNSSIASSGTSTTLWLYNSNLLKLYGSAINLDSNVGIGIDSPSHKFHVLGTSAYLQCGTTYTKDIMPDVTGTNYSVGTYDKNFALGCFNVLFGGNNNNTWIRSNAASGNSYGIVFGYGGGNVSTTLGKWTYTGLGIGTTSPAYKLDVNGDINATDVICGYAYSKSNNMAAFVFDKPGSNWTGIGAVGVSDTIHFGPCSRAGAWVSNYNQKWEFQGDVYAKGGVTALASSSSDKRLKKNIKPFNATEIVDKLKPIQFEWNSKAKKYNSNFKDGTNYGLIAQDSDNIIDDLVFDLPDGKGYKGVRYEKLIPILLQAIKEQQKEINELKKLVKK